jgi:hypothetical protein
MDPIQFRGRLSIEKTKMNTQLSAQNLKHLSDVSLIAGILSIAASIATWLSRKEDDRAHAERFGIFIGLWVPSLLILSNRLSRLAEEQEPRKHQAD